MRAPIAIIAAAKRSNGKARFLMGSACGALAVACAFAPPALAGTYHATDNTSLAAAINSANADPDASGTVILDNDIALGGSVLPGNTKPITIDTNGHTYTRAWTDNSTGTVATVNMNGTAIGSIYILNGNFQGAGIGAGGSGAGDYGLFATTGKTITNNGTITGGAGGGLGGDGGLGVRLTGTTTFTNAGTIAGGSAVNGNGASGVLFALGVQFNNSGTIRGGDGLTGGIGVTTQGPTTKTMSNSGAITGGKGTTGAGGDGVRLSQGNSLDNSGTITGGDGAFGGAGVNSAGSTASVIANLTNSGTIKGGNGNGGAGGNGVIVHSFTGTITNTGSISGGNGAAAIMNTGIAGATNAPVNLINSGTITAGAGYDTAILMQVPSNLSLELHKGSAITGAVVGNTGAAANTLILGGDDNASFDVSTVGPQYQNFTAYQKTGASTWSLIGTGTAATPWVISQGTLQVGDGTATGSFIGDVTDNATLAFNRSDVSTFGNLITGTGGVNQVGSGKTNLTSVNTYSGPTNVSGGTLSVNGSIANSAVTVASGGTLGGNGTVGATTIASGGTVAPGNSVGTLHVSGAFVQSAGSIYQVEVDPTSNASDLVLVNGTASVANGANLNIVKNPSGDYQAGAHYTILTASGGVTGSYGVPGAGAISQFLALEEQQDANNIYLNVVQTGDPAGAAQTQNQTGVAGAVDSLPLGNSVSTGVLNSPSDAAARSAFDALSGEALASARGALVSGSLLVRDTSFDRLRDLFCNGGTADDASLHSGCGMAQDRPVVWVRGFGNWGHASGNANAAGLTQSTGGFLAGADVPVYDWRIGVFGGYSRTAFDVTAAASYGVSDNYHLGAYGGTQWGDLGLKLGASYSWNDVATDRAVTVGSLADNLTAQYNAGTAQIFGELGEQFTMDQVTLEPFANLAYVNLRTDGFSETGGDAALTSRANTMEDGFATLGVRPSTTVSWGGYDATLRGMVGWRHTFGSVTPTSIVSFANSNAFTVEGAPIARDAGVVEAGMDFAVARGIAFGLTYGGQFSGAETDHGIRGTLAIAF